MAVRRLEKTGTRKVFSCVECGYECAYTTNTRNGRKIAAMHECRGIAVATIMSAIDENVSQFYADEITYEEFGANQRRLWDSAKEQCISERVATMFRNRL